MIEMHSPRPRPKPSNSVVKSRPLVGSFEENILNMRLEPVRRVDGYSAEIRASSRNFQPSPLNCGVQVSFFSAGNCFPYLGRVHIGQRGYKIPSKGTLQVTLFNPNGTLVKLFVLFYDLTDMPPNSQTFLRQKTLYLPVDTDRLNIERSSLIMKHKSNNQKLEEVSLRSRVRYMIQLNIVSSKSGRIYLNNDLRIFVSKKVDLDTAFQLANKEDFVVEAIDEMPVNPRYFSR